MRAAAVDILYGPKQMATTTTSISTGIGNGRVSRRKAMATATATLPLPTPFSGLILLRASARSIRRRPAVSAARTHPALTRSSLPIRVRAAASASSDDLPSSSGLSYSLNSCVRLLFVQHSEFVPFSSLLPTFLRGVLV